VTDLGSDLWFLHQWFINDFLFVSGVGVDGQAGTFLQIDSKAMRKVDEDQNVVLVGELSAVGSGFNLTTAGRLMLKEH